MTVNQETLSAAAAEAEALLRNGYSMEWLNVPRQLGFGPRYANRGRRRLPESVPALRECALWLHSQFVEKWGVKPNILYVQMCATSGVSPHQDPATDLVGTSILYLGDFQGGDLVFVKDGQTITLPARPGVINHLPCTVNGIRGPRHWTTPHTGTRISLILNYNNR